MGDDLLSELLRGTTVPDSLARPRAKDGCRAAAVALRASGATYDQIAAELGVSKSSCSLWLRDLPQPDPAGSRARRISALRSRARRDRDARDLVDDAVTTRAAAWVGPVTSRDLVLALAVSYWCEGAKRKPWNRVQAVRWINSDPVLVTLFLEGLAMLGIERERLVLRVHVHETACEAEVRTWWSEHTGVPLAQFRRSQIKRHNPLTPRQNTGADYRGCLAVNVLQGRQLYRTIAGVVAGLSEGPRRDEWQDEASAAQIITLRSRNPP